MYKDGLVWMADTENGEHINLIPKMANRHGLIAGATGTGKTITLKVMAEAFSDMGVPVFMADVKGDLAGTMAAGEDSENMQKRIAKFHLDEAGFAYQGYPVTLWDLFGEKGIQLRTTISEVGPLLLARILNLNDLQSDILTIVFKIADDRNLLLIDTKDLKAMLNFCDENKAELQADYGRISSASIGAITRAVVALEMAGADVFFGEPALNIADWLVRDPDGKGMINILDSESLINNGKLYSTFLLWLMSELFESLPEVGDMERPKLVFFFDEAHLLFDDASPLLLDKIEQVVKLIRSKGVGIYFVTQNPRDIPDGVLAQLGNKVQHALHAYTPADQKGLKAAADSFRVNPEFRTIDVLQTLGTGEALISFLDEKGAPAIVQKAYVLPPKSRMGVITDAERDSSIKGSLLYSRYAEGYDPDSAYEFLQRKGLAEQAEAEKQAAEEAAAEEARKKAKLTAAEEAEYRRELEKLHKEEAAKEKEMAAYAKEAARQQAAAQKEAEKRERTKKRQIKSVGKTVAGTVGREVGKQVGKSFGSFGKKLGGNVGASLGRGLLDTLFRI
ncbi:MAG: helicase HerA-like domain-containing protein [Eubacterium sp.]|nr:helicase HerA-like domain-containing protein [Eubacterium sp.]